MMGRKVATVANLKTGNECVVGYHEHTHQDDPVEFAQHCPDEAHHRKNRQGPLRLGRILQVPERSHPHTRMSAGVVVGFATGAQDEAQRIEQGEGREQEEPNRHGNEGLGEITERLRDAGPNASSGPPPAGWRSPRRDTCSSRRPGEKSRQDIVPARAVVIDSHAYQATASTAVPRNELVSMK